VDKCMTLLKRVRAKLVFFLEPSTITSTFLCLKTRPVHVSHERPPSSITHLWRYLAITGGVSGAPGGILNRDVLLRVLRVH
jgi:hypothetical protein